MMTYRILLVGTYCGLNKGDRLMQQVFADQLRIHSDINFDITLASPFPEIDKTLYDFRVVKSRRRNLPLSTLKVLALICTPAIVRRWLAKCDPELSEFMKADVVVDLSGDMLTEDYGVHVAYSHALPLIFSALLRRRLFIVAQSVGPFKRLKPLFRALLRNAEAITLRDPVSYRYLTEEGLPNIVQLADLGFLLPTQKKEDLRFKSKSKFQLGIAPSSLLKSKFTGKLRNRGRNVIFELAELIEQLCSRFDAEIVLIPHVESPIKAGDFELCEELARHAGANCKVLDKDLTPPQTKGFISQMDAMIAFRMHAAIAAIDSEVPTIVVSYSHKTIGLFEQFELSRWVVNYDADLIRNLEDKLERLIAERVAIKNKISEKLQEIRPLARKNIDIILEELQKSA